MDRKNHAGFKIFFDLRDCQEQHGTLFHGGGYALREIFSQIMNAFESLITTVILDNSLQLPDSVGQVVREDRLNVINPGHQSIVDAHKLDPGRETVIVTATMDDSWTYDYGEDISICTIIHGPRVLDMPTDVCEIRYRKGIADKIKAITKMLFKDRYYAMFQSRYNAITSSRHLGVVTSSFSSKASLLKHLPALQSSKVAVIYPPLPSLIVTSNDDAAKVLGKYGLIEKEFFLVENADRWIKNAHRIIRALALIEKRRPSLLGDHKVVLTGNVTMPLPSGIRRRVISLGYIDESELVVLKAKSKALLYGSVNEGFGYPPLQSMHYGVPVIASSAASIPEVSGTACIYCNPLDIEDIATKVVLVLLGDHKMLCEPDSSRYDRFLKEGSEYATNLVQFIQSQLHNR